MEMPQMPQVLTKFQEQFVRDNFLSDQFLDFIQKNTLPLETMITYYECAIMEVETKF